MNDDSKPQELLAPTTEIAPRSSATLCAVSDLPALIASVFQALHTTGQAEPEEPPQR